VYITYQLHVKANAPVAIVDKIYQRSYIDTKHVADKLYTPDNIVVL